MKKSYRKIQLSAILNITNIKCLMERSTSHVVSLINVGLETKFNSKHGLLSRPHFALTQSTASRSWAIYSPLLRCHKLRQRKTWHASYMPWVEFNSNHGLSQFNISKIASISGITSWIELTQNYVWMSRGSGFLNQVITVSSTLSLYWNKPSQSERNLKFNFAHNKHHLLNYLPSYHSIYTEWGSPSSN